MAYVTVGDAGVVVSEAPHISRNAALRPLPQVTLQRLPDGSTRLSSPKFSLLPVVGGVAVLGVLALVFLRKKG